MSLYFLLIAIIGGSLISNSSGNGGIEQNQDIVTQINKLRDLLKSGVLTEEEFKKAKEKILN